jgi:hypothetical protein
MRFDYIAWSLVLMVWACVVRILNARQINFAVPMAIVVFTIGTVLWVVQTEQTADWQSCNVDYQASKARDTLLVSSGLLPLYAPDPNITPFRSRFCQWDWATPWADMLFSKTGIVDSWTILTFWQNFDFIKKDGTPYLHTNNWTLTSPSILASEADLPLKTLLYDLTPLYSKLGDGPFLKHIHCVPPAMSGSYWYRHLELLDDQKRLAMNVCPAK